MSVELNLIPSCRVSEFDQREDEFLLFFRLELDVEYRSIEETQAKLVQLPEKTPWFDESCEAAAQLTNQEEAVSLVGKYLTSWISDEIFVKF
jgi:hypothetical protein